MNRKKRLLGIGLTLMLGGSLAVVPRTLAQENTAEASRRKVRTKATPEYPQLAKADARNRQSENRGYDFGGWARNQHQSDRREPAAGGLGSGSVEKMALRAGRKRNDGSGGV